MAQNIQETITSRDALLLELKGAIRLREKAEEEIKTLSGLIPICMHCKEIRNDKGLGLNLKSLLQNILWPSSATGFAKSVWKSIILKNMKMNDKLDNHQYL